MSIATIDMATFSAVPYGTAIMEVVASWCGVEFPVAERAGNDFIFQKDSAMASLESG